MVKTRILIVEDEIIIADHICETLAELGYETLEPAISYSEGVEAIEKHQPDLVILDIQLSGKKDGIDLAWKIKEDYDLPFIFLTSNADKYTVERAKKVMPPAYLVKPFNKDDLFTSIEIALFNFTKANKDTNSAVIVKDALFIKQNKAFVKVGFDEIEFVRSEHVYLEIYTSDDRKILVRDSLNDYMKKLTDRFFRIHRSYIINIDFLKTIEATTIWVGSHELPIAKNFREELLHKVKIG